MAKYCLSTMRKKAYRVGYKIEKGFQHYLYGDCPVYIDANGERYSGYSIFDLSDNMYTSNSYSNVFDNLLSLEDVEEFLMSVYEKEGMKY